MGMLDILPPQTLPPGIDRQDFSGKIGWGGYELTVYQPDGHPRHGGPMALLVGGYGDHYGLSREPLALSLAAVGIRAGVVRQTQRTNPGVATHARPQRARGVHGAQQDAIEVFQPDLLIVDGHSFGGDNVFDAEVHDLVKRPFYVPKQLVVIDEDTPGVSEPFHMPAPNVRHLLKEEFHEYLQPGPPAMRMALHRLAGMIETMVELPVLAAEGRALHHICVEPEKQFLLRSGIPVFDVVRRHDNIVPPPLHPSPQTYPLDGNHLTTAFHPEQMVDFITGRVLPNLGY